MQSKQNIKIKKYKAPKKWKFYLANGELLMPLTFYKKEIKQYFPTAIITHDSVYLKQGNDMNLEFIFEIWLNECLESFLCADSVYLAREYFDEGLLPFEFENVLEDKWLATQKYY